MRISINRATLSEIQSDELLNELLEDLYNNIKNHIIPHTKTGRMENNLMIVRDSPTLGYVAISNTGMMTRFGNYAKFVHFGTRNYRGDPFMYRGLLDTEHNFRNIRSRINVIR